MNKPVLENCKVLQAQEFEFTTKKGDKGTGRTVLILYANKPLRLKYSAEAKLLEYVDQEVDLEIELSTFGDSMTPSIRVVGVV